MKRWGWRGWRRAAWIGDSDWELALEQLPGLHWLSDHQRLNLRSRAEQLLARKPIETVAGFALEPAMRLRIAMLAALPVINLDLGWYRNFYTFLIYPDDFLVDREIVDEAGVVHRVREPLAGETASQGAVILSWSAVETSGLGDGFNVVVHELAHKLDLLGGDGSGMPSLGDAAWSRAWERDFEALRRALADDPDPPLDPYAATDPVECFAVCSEYFFDAPHHLREHAPQIYRHLARFYRIDPDTGGIDPAPG